VGWSNLKVEKSGPSWTHLFMGANYTYLLFDGKCTKKMIGFEIKIEYQINDKIEKNISFYPG